MAQRSLMEGIPEPASASQKAAARPRSSRNVVLGIVAALVLAAAALSFYVQSRPNIPVQSTSASAADAKLRADLAAKNPPPPPPTEPVEVGGGHKPHR